MSSTHASSTEGQSGSRRPPRTAALAAFSLSLALGALPLTAANPAQAAFPSKATQAPCTVTAKRPYATGSYQDWPRLKLVAHPIEVTCTEGSVTVYVEQQLREADPGKDDYQRDYFTPENTPMEFYVQGTKQVHTLHPLDHLDPWGNEEVYHKVRFRIVSVHGNSQWVYAQSPEYSVNA